MKKIFVVFLVTAEISTLYPQYCDTISAKATEKAALIMREYASTYGNAHFTRKIQVCVGKTKFAEVKGGARMQAFYDRKTETVFLRALGEKNLRHEVLHAYIDKKLMYPPYYVSEKLVNSLQFNTDGCDFSSEQIHAYEKINMQDWLIEQKPPDICRDFFLADKLLRSGQK